MEKFRIARISGNFGACTDSVYKAFFSSYEREPEFEPIIKTSLSGFDIRTVAVVGYGYD